MERGIMIRNTTVIPLKTGIHIAANELIIVSLMSVSYERIEAGSPIKRDTINMDSVVRRNDVEKGKRIGGQPNLALLPPRP